VADDAGARILNIRDTIHEVCLRIGRDPKEIKLMGVSKFQALSAVEEAWKGGIRLFGENRVQEGIEKFASFREHFPARRECEIHLIGSLQRNKAKKAADFFDCIQSVDREPLIEELGALTLGKKDPLMVLLEYHTGETSKAGFPDLDSLCRGAEKVLSFPGLHPLGLMTIAPFTDDKKAVRAAFRSCYLAVEELKKRFPVENAWSCLSMGMSGDFEIALEEGSTLIRIGTAIFGERRP
jgi:pyridoxal phosphate enzyme (YggS family)